MNAFNHENGFTLFELIVALAVLGLIMVSFQQVLGQALTTHKDTRERLEKVSHARFAMDRMVFLIKETGFVENPVQGGSAEALVIEERSMDAYNNLTQAFAPDGIPDADKDSNTLINDDAIDDPVDRIFISLDKTDPGNWKLVEVMPDYGTATASDYMSQRILCENITRFEVSRGSADEKQHHLVKIELEIGSAANRVSFTTRSIAGKLLVL